MYDMKMFARVPEAQKTTRTSAQQADYFLRKSDKLSPGLKGTSLSKIQQVLINITLGIIIKTEIGIALQILYSTFRQEVYEFEQHETQSAASIAQFQEYCVAPLTELAEFLQQLSLI